MADREYSSAATPGSLGRGLIFGICTSRKGGKNAVGDHNLRDQKIPTVTEALRPLTSSVSNTSLS